MQLTICFSAIQDHTAPQKTSETRGPSVTDAGQDRVTPITGQSSEVNFKPTGRI